MFESIMGMQNSLLGEQPTSKDTSHNPNKTRDRLRRKLEKKQSGYPLIFRKNHPNFQ